MQILPDENGRYDFITREWIDETKMIYKELGLYFPFVEIEGYLVPFQSDGIVGYKIYEIKGSK